MLLLSYGHRNFIRSCTICVRIRILWHFHWLAVVRYTIEYTNHLRIFPAVLPVLLFTQQQTFHFTLYELHCIASDKNLLRVPMRIVSNWNAWKSRITPICEKLRLKHAHHLHCSLWFSEFFERPATLTTPTSTKLRPDLSNRNIPVRLLCTTLVAYRH